MLSTTFTCPSPPLVLLAPPSFQPISPFFTFLLTRLPQLPLKCC